MSDGRPFHEYGHMMCCGISELHEIRGVSPEDFFSSACIAQVWDAKAQKHKPTNEWCRVFAAHVLFTDIDTPYKPKDAPFKYGDMWMRYIRAQGLGTVHETTAERNPNTGNLVKAYLWRPIPALREQYEEPEDDDFY